MIKNLLLLILVTIFQGITLLLVQLVYEKIWWSIRTNRKTTFTEYYVMNIEKGRLFGIFLIFISNFVISFGIALTTFILPLTFTCFAIFYVLPIFLVSNLKQFCINDGELIKKISSLKYIELIFYIFKIVLIDSEVKISRKQFIFNKYFIFALVIFPLILVGSITYDLLWYQRW